MDSSTDLTPPNPSRDTSADEIIHTYDVSIDEITHTCDTSADEIIHTYDMSVDEITHTCDMSADEITHTCDTSADEITHTCDTSADEIAQLVATLRALAKQKTSKRYKLVKENSYVHEPTKLQLSSWRMSDWEYKRENCPYPTMARGLFTRYIPSEQGGKKNGRHEIVARGYDKFFNIGETSKTQWSWIEAHTTAPYEITTKENGCIIFLAGLPGDELLVTSKHSTGLGSGMDRSHAMAGEGWAEKHLATVGQTKKDLARWLRARHLTAVAELCDDAFEEHVLEYPENQRGLYLHGLNYNQPTLRTLPSTEVQAIAHQFGFRTAGLTMRTTVDDTRRFIDEVRHTCEFEGRAVEGFVVRCKLEPPLGGTDYFFKVKYDDPYLMYREWRELTKALLRKQEPRYTYPLSRHYADWVRREMIARPFLFAEYNHNMGIIRVRDMFLDWWEKEGKPRSEAGEPSGELQVSEKEKKEEYDKCCLLTIATVGCGKTTLSLTLENLFSFGHIQSDDITTKKPAAKFYKLIADELEKKEVVIADRNNHLVDHRNDLTKAIKLKFPNTRFVALYWTQDKHPHDEIYKTTLERVHARGDNHQSLRPSDSKVESVMHRFFCEFAPLDKLSNPGDAAIDNVIELDPLDDEATTLRKVISQLCPLIGVREPSDDEVQSALVYAKQYRPIARSKAPKPMYYGVKLDNDLQELLKLYLAQHAVRVDELTQQRFQKLVSDKRVPKDHHVTLLHSIDLKQAKGPELEKKQAMWNKFADAAGKDGGQGQHVTVRFCGLVSTDRLMTLEVAEIVPADVASVNKIAHVTVGTANDTVKPKESNTVLEQKEDIGPEHGILRTVLFGMGGEGMEMTGHVKAFY